MGGPPDWFTVFGFLLIVLILVGLLVYSICSRTPTPRNSGAPVAEKTAE